MSDRYQAGRACPARFVLSIVVPQILHHRLGAGMDVEFFVDLLEVLADGVDGDIELGGDFFVIEALGKEGEDLVFALGEV